MDPAEYRRIAAKYLNAVYRCVFAYCRSKENAEDATQNAFVKLFEADTEFADDEHIKRWLIRTAVNECKDGWRSFGSRRIVSLEDIDKEPSYTQSEYTQSERKELPELLLKLPKNYRVVLHLYYYEGFSVKQTAEILGISESNAQNRLMRARKKLKELIEREEWL